MAFLKLNIFSKKKRTKSATAKKEKSSNAEKKRGAESIDSASTQSTSSSVANAEVSSQMRERIELGKEYIRRMNKHDLDALRELFNDDFRFVFSDHEQRWKDFEDEAPKLFAAFPDFNLQYSHIEALEDGSIKVRNILASGTHTGTPFSFGPFEPIPTTGKFVKNDPEEIRIVFDEENKMRCHEITALGEMTGFSGFYTGLGGFPLL